MYPQVTNCVVLGVEDREHEQGHLPLAVVELKNGVADSNAVRRELFQLFRDEAEQRSQPVDIVFVGNIPTTKMAKNDYRALEEDFRDYDYHV